MNITTTTFAAAAIAACLLSFLSLPACASDDHAHAQPALSAAAPAAARFALVSDTLELVGVLNGRQLTLYLDHAADNSPVPGARIALDIGGQRVGATPHGDVYDGDLPAAAKPGHLPVSATVTVGDVRSVLSGELDLPDTAMAAGAAAHGHAWSRAVVWSAVALAVVLALTLAFVLGVVLRARRARRQRAISSTTGSAA